MGKHTMNHLAGVVLLCAATLSVAAEHRGIPARTSRSQYFVTSFTHQMAVAATLVPREQVRRRFGSVDRDYVVLEVGVYSKTGVPVQVRHSDFELRLPAAGVAVKPAAPSEITELLPEGVTTQQVAGYLFFPAHDTGSGACEVGYNGNGVWFDMPVRYGR